eukprot:CAMPEP_0113715984 /NCGR_PEP_ID=MMETSP0038_2-20120614/33613_1 /TAXON_ID=2898 /ORGANISM="Cryptomonas paramecium" /LENGTH=48 /DNA_ID=CAMNT_0000643407 /DNA_START=1342 /DNA_END=1488 /DNA_ORIENTATION=- /assembly_acc=CAM_ASM_000170
MSHLLPMAIPITNNVTKSWAGQKRFNNLHVHGSGMPNAVYLNANDDWN